MSEQLFRIKKSRWDPSKADTLKAAWTISCLVSFFYLFTEWIFLVTKPSSMSMVPFAQKFSNLLFSISLLTLVCSLVQLIIFLLFCDMKRGRAWSIRLIMIMPGTILAAAILLLVDNFTYIIIGFGIITSKGLIRAFYGAAFLGLVVYLIQDLSRLHETISRSWKESNTRRKDILLTVLGSLMFITVAAIFLTGIRQKPWFKSSATHAENRKNILLITADGLNAEQMSVYGYWKETTPFLKTLIPKALIAQNHFTNSGSTTGSLTSLLTGRYPTTLRVLSRPDILRGEDCYRSLPALLKSSGYHNEQYSFGLYADAFAINFKNAFDFANGYTATSNSVLGLTELPIPTNEEYFLYELKNRLLPRIKHIFFIRVMENEFQEVSNLAKFSKEYVDKEKILQALDTLTRAEEPVFLHLHWMKTHGAFFEPRNRVFSAGKDTRTQAPWDPLFYEDVILDFDEDLAYLYTELEKLGVLKETIIVIGSDHGWESATDRRIPLIFLFPQGDYHGKIYSDTQNLDIAPTLLEYLGMDIPEWMEGKSLLSGEPGARAIFGVQNLNTDYVEEQGWIADDTYSKPPFYQFDTISLENCGRISELNLETFTWSQSNVSAYQSQCRYSEILDSQTIRSLIIERLIKDKFQFEETLVPLP